MPGRSIFSHGCITFFNSSTFTSLRVPTFPIVITSFIGEKFGVVSVFVFEFVVCIVFILDNELKKTDNGSVENIGTSSFFNG